MGELPRRISSAGAVLLAMGMVMVFVLDARAASVEPVLYEHTNVFCSAPTENQTGLGLDLVAKFGSEGHPLVDGESSGSGVTVDLDVEGGTVLSWDSGEILIGAVIVKGGDDSNVYLYPGGATGDTNLVTPLNNGGNRPAISHVDFCAAPPPTEVDVSVALGTCAFDEETEESKTPLTVTMAGDGSATVVVKDADDVEIASFTEGGSIDVLPGSYSFEVTAGAGSVLSDTSDASGTVVAGDCAPSVLGAGTVSVTTGACTFEDGLSNTPVEVLIAPDGAASVTLTGDGFSQGFTGDGGSVVVTPGDYSWTAVANDGFELLAGSSGSFTADECAVVFGRRLARTGTGSTIAVIGIGALLLGWAIRWGEQRLVRA